MIIKPTKIGKKVNMDLSLFLKNAKIPVIQPTNPKAAMVKVGRGIEYWILVHINIMKAMLSPIDHLPMRVLGIA